MIGKGRKGGFITLAERRTRLYLALPIVRNTVMIVKSGLIKLLSLMAQFVHTITYDNGCEFSLHAAVSKALNCQGDFARPYHSWEQGLNEQSHGLLRRFFPKSIALDTVTEEALVEVINKFNNRPRKYLGFKTPLEVFKALTKQQPTFYSCGALMV